MTIVQAVSNRIIELCNENNISINKLATISGITQSTLSDIVNCKSKNPTLKTISLLCYGLDIDLKTFFDSNDFTSIYD